MLYPAMLNITGKKAVVVGGGPVAARKVRSLAAAGAQIEVISPEVSEAMSQLLGCNGVRWLRKEFSPSDLVGPLLLLQRRTAGKPISSLIKALLPTSSLTWQMIRRKAALSCQLLSKKISFL
ncbi:hypothetical protein CJ483_02670 [Bacillus sp. PK3_68]|nr:hypothetical protein CJ483_02670 [Bacillus sp. PK3_68]